MWCSWVQVGVRVPHCYDDLLERYLTARAKGQGPGQGSFVRKQN